MHSLYSINKICALKNQHQREGEGEGERKKGKIGKLFSLWMCRNVENIRTERTLLYEEYKEFDKE